jgi:hypothetical protein
VEDDNQGESQPDSIGKGQPFVGIETSIQNLTTKILV